MAPNVTEASVNAEAKALELNFKVEEFSTILLFSELIPAFSVSSSPIPLML